MANNIMVTFHDTLFLERFYFYLCEFFYKSSALFSELGPLNKASSYEQKQGEIAQTLITEEAGVKYLEQYKKDLFLYIYKYFGDKDIAEDVFQDVCYQIWSLIKKKPIVDKNIKSWMFHIAVNVCKKERSKVFKERKKLSYELEDTFVDERENPEGAMKAKEFAEEMDTVVRNLPDELKSVVILKFMYNHTQAEIAQILKLTEMSVSRKLQKAYKFMAEKMKSYTGGE